MRRETIAWEQLHSELTSETLALAHSQREVFHCHEQFFALALVFVCHLVCLVQVPSADRVRR